MENCIIFSTSVGASLPMLLLRQRCLLFAQHSERNEKHRGPAQENLTYGAYDVAGQGMLYE